MSEIPVPLLRLARTDELSVYEKFGLEHVDAIATEIQADQVLKDPPICDLRRNLLIDGQHRMRALSRLGVRWMPVFDVDYLSAEVEIRNWFYELEGGSPRSVASALRDAGLVAEQRPEAKDGKTDFVICQPDSADLRISGANPQETSEAMIAFIQRMRSAGWKVRRVPTMHASGQGENSCTLLLDPAIDKASVLDSAETGRPFPPQINRHLISGRPLRVDFPIESGRLGRDEAEKVLSRIMNDCSPRRVSGTPYNGRLYEESVVVLAPGTEGSGRA